MLDNKYILFLIDGARVSGEFAGNLDFNMLDLSNVEKIELQSFFNSDFELETTSEGNVPVHTIVFDEEQIRELLASYPTEIITKELSDTLRVVIQNQPGLLPSCEYQIIQKFTAATKTFTSAHVKGSFL